MQRRSIETDVTASRRFRSRDGLCLTKHYKPCSDLFNVHFIGNISIRYSTKILTASYLTPNFFLPSD